MPDLTRTAPWALVLCAALAGCTTTKEDQLQNVARDWALVIRASQVIPVYPLTEDLRPGDIFLVETPLQEKTQYEGDGFLRLDQHLERLHDLDYMTFYEQSHGITDVNVRPPEHWQFPETPPAQTPNTSGTPPRKHTGATAWSIAPGAAFPTYTFKVNRGAGASIALPVSGVPIGLSLMQTDSASGTITLADVYTYGVSLHELRDKVKDWHKQHGHKTLLRKIRAAAGREIYVRVVSRVYLTGRVVVNMSNTRAFEAAGKAGAAEDVTLPPPRPAGVPGTEAERAAAPSAAENAARIARVEKDRVDAVQAALDAMPGAAVKIVQASSRTVTMNETFRRPLVVGFLGFDFPVLESGDLGPPLSTRARLGGQKVPTRIGVLTDSQKEYLILRHAIDGSPNRDQIYDAAAAALGDKFETAYKTNKASTQNSTRAFKAGKDAAETTTWDAYDALMKAWDARP